MFASAEKPHPGIFPSFRKAECLFVASDYGGEHGGAVYETISYLIADIADCANWQSTRERIRAQFLPDGRRMAFKNLNDRVRRRALEPFLQSANQLPALLATFAVPKSVRSLFHADGPLDPKAFELEVLRACCYFNTGNNSCEEKTMNRAWLGRSLFILSKTMPQIKKSKRGLMVIGKP